MDREIWFDKILWSYMPCHWKGWAVIAAFVVPTILAITLAESALDWLGYTGADWLPFLLFFPPMFFLLDRVSKRHSR